METTFMHDRTNVNRQELGFCRASRRGESREGKINMDQHHAIFEHFGNFQFPILRQILTWRLQLHRHHQLMATSLSVVIEGFHIEKVPCPTLSYDMDESRRRGPVGGLHGHRQAQASGLGHRVQHRLLVHIVRCK